MKKSLFLLLLLFFLISGCALVDEDDYLVEENNTINEEIEEVLSEYDILVIYQAELFCSMMNASLSEDYKALETAVLRGEEVAQDLGFSVEYLDNLSLRYETDINFQNSVLVEVENLCNDIFLTYLDFVSN